MGKEQELQGELGRQVGPAGKEAGKWELPPPQWCRGGSAASNKEGGWAVGRGKWELPLPPRGKGRMGLLPASFMGPSLHSSL